MLYLLDRHVTEVQVSGIFKSSTIRKSNNLHVLTVGFFY